MGDPGLNYGEKMQRHKWKVFSETFQKLVNFFFLLICCKLKCDQFLENKIKYQVHINAY